MILSYTDLFGLGNRRRREIKATVTSDHPVSHYGIPVIVLNDGNALDLQSWVMLGYQVVKASSKEKLLLSKVFENFNSMCVGF